MSRIFMDGFESGDLTLWNSTGSIATQTGKSGNYCMGVSQNQISIITLPGSYQNIYFACKLWWSANKTYIYFFNGATALAVLGNNIAPNWSFYRGNWVTSLAASSNPTLSSTWGLYEGWYKPKTDGTGRFTLKYNGIIIIDFTGQTADSALLVTSIQFYNPAASSIYYVDDFIVDDAAFIGPSSIQGLAVTGAGNSAQFDPSTGSNYACVDEIPPSDADYISTNVADEIDTYACGNLTGTINSVKAVQVQARCMQEGSPAVPKIQLVTRPTSTDRVSASKSVQTFAPSTVANIWELNPDDSAAWAEADVNGMEIGVKAVAS